MCSSAFDHSNDDGPTDKLLIIQCDSGHLYGDLVACARYRVDDERERALRLHGRSHHRVTHVLFIINFPKKQSNTSSKMLVGFQGGAWISTYIDDIRVQYCQTNIAEANTSPISKLFYNMEFNSISLETPEQQKVQMILFHH